MSEPIVLKGNDFAENIKQEVTAAVVGFKARGIAPRLAVVVTVNDASVNSYIVAKQKLAEQLGVVVDVVDASNLDQTALEKKISELSADKSIHGIILEWPTAENIDATKAELQIDSKKDIDGLTPTNLGLLAAGREEEAIISATTQACLMLAESQGSITGKNVAVVGYGRTVGRPLTLQLLNRHATVEVAHTKTQDLGAVIKKAEVVFVGIGDPEFITDKHLGQGQIIIDVGINYVDGKLVGDVNYEVAKNQAAAITPVPGGVGPLTTVILFKNLMRAIELQQS